LACDHRPVRARPGAPTWWPAANPWSERLREYVRVFSRHTGRGWLDASLVVGSLVLGGVGPVVQGDLVAVPALLLGCVSIVAMVKAVDVRLNKRARAKALVDGGPVHRLLAGIGFTALAPALVPREMAGTRQLSAAKEDQVLGAFEGSYIGRRVVLFDFMSRRGPVKFTSMAAAKLETSRPPFRVVPSRSALKVKGLREEALPAGLRTWLKGRGAEKASLAFEVEGLWLSCKTDGYLTESTVRILLDRISAFASYLD
jgi:hypothetical protein